MPIAPDVKLGEKVSIFHPDLTNLYGCSIGDDTKVGTFVEIQKNAAIGARSSPEKPECSSPDCSWPGLSR